MLTLSLATITGDFEVPDKVGGTISVTGGTAVALMYVRGLCTHFQHDESDDSLDGTVDTDLALETAFYDASSSLVATVTGPSGVVPLTMTVNSSFVPGASTGAAIANASYQSFVLDTSFEDARLVVSLDFTMVDSTHLTGSVIAAFEGSHTSFGLFDVASPPDVFHLLINGCAV